MGERLFVLLRRSVTVRWAVVRVITLVLVVTGAVEKNPNQIGAVKRVERFLQLSFSLFASRTIIIRLSRAPRHWYPPPAE